VNLVGSIYPVSSDFRLLWGIENSALKVKIFHHFTLFSNEASQQKLPRWSISFQYFDCKIISLKNRLTPATAK
jgi:hypothetical protein